MSSHLVELGLATDPRQAIYTVPPGPPLVIQAVSWTLAVSSPVTDITPTVQILDQFGSVLAYLTAPAIPAT